MSCTKKRLRFLSKYLIKPQPHSSGCGFYFLSIVTKAQAALKTAAIAEM